MPESIQCCILIADGTEEIEAVTIIDLLRRAELSIDVLSIAPNARLDITCSRGVRLLADKHFDDIDLNNYQLWIIPGGLKGSQSLAQYAPLIDSLMSRESTWLASMCAAPALVLEQNGVNLCANKTCHPDFMHLIAASHLVQDLVVVDKHHQLITAQGPGTAMRFSLAIIAELVGEAKAAQIALALTGLD